MILHLSVKVGKSPDLAAPILGNTLGVSIDSLRLVSPLLVVMRSPGGSLVLSRRLRRVRTRRMPLPALSGAEGAPLYVAQLLVKNRCA